MCYTKKAQEKIEELAGDGKFNARDLRKAIRDEVEDPIAQYLIDHFDQKVSAVSLDAGEKLELSFL